MNNILETADGLRKFISEVHKIKSLIHGIVSSWDIDIEIVENKKNGFDLYYGDQTTSVFFFSPNDDSAISSHLIWIIGETVARKATKNHESEIFDFGINSEEFGWIERGENKEFYSSNKIVNTWMSKYLNRIKVSK